MIPTPDRRRAPRQPTAEQNGRRLADIESLQFWAASLLTIARHETMRDALRAVIGELNDRHELFLEPHTNATPPPWMRIDLTTAHVRWCLSVIAGTLETDGRDAAFDPASTAWS